MTGCADLFKATALGQNIERKKQRDRELIRRFEESERYFALYQEADAAGDIERCEQLEQEYLAKQRHYELMDRLDRIEESQRDMECANYQRWLQDNY